jgi:tryptophan synthase alpha chain
MANGRDRLRAMFASTASEGRAALLPYLTAGLPTVEDSVSFFEAMADAGADGFEVGIPYADPLMDGPVIMEAGERALRAGVTVDVALDVVARVVTATGKPVLVMTYVNPVLHQGIETFFGKVRDVGAAGVIVADLPADESEEFVDAARATGLGMVQFAAPTTGPMRLASIASSDPVFVYGIAEIGVTGERTEASSNLERLAEEVRSVTDAPLVFGVGISTPDQAAAVGRVGDGVIVGTAIVRRVLEAGSAGEARAELSAAVDALVTAMRAD